ncbi:uncharacterized protein DUF4325 [Pacificibacter maritimus]|uniref:Uncharacterized protein DUF4325 n=1 Tax=Pacificibacter maritimus TaxID=762213 RepID=A0A3N4TZ42_9RHOB|nr:DUF4325 domain-containing protein [Pacificibacter maritimus]RPE63078.1 uncharacterized protein DUF4325 [Pacificibacter maritimus]
MNTIEIAKEFSPYPGGRYPEDGPANGTDFRNRHLVPVLKAHQKAQVLLDGALGYPSSFLEEAFGGLVRAGYTAKQIKETFDIKTNDPTLERFLVLIQQYIDGAKAKQ